MSLDLYFEEKHAQRGSESWTKRAARATEAIRDGLFQSQRDFVDDPARRKSALTPRRAGKTTACVAMMMLKALESAGANIVYLCVTRGQAQRLIWTSLKNLAHDHDLDITFHETFLRATLPNRSTIQLQGAETRAEIDKLRGQSFDLAIVDEAKSLDTDVLDELLTEVVGPALNDRLGQVALTGTPGNILAGSFYNATVEGLPGVRPYGKDWEAPYRWSFHSWSMKDNTALPHLWELAMAEKEANGWGDDDPRWQREYCGRWTASDDVMVYRFAPERNIWTPNSKSLNHWGLPDEHEWIYIIGIDLGFEDDFAAVVCAYSETCPTLYQVWDYKSPHLTVNKIAAVLKKAEEMFGSFDSMVADTGGLGRTVVETLNQEYGFYFDAAEKREKHDYIELLNSDLVNARLMIHPESQLVTELPLLQWKDSRRKAVNKATGDHVADALLYTWRYAYHHYSQPHQSQLGRGERERWREWERAEIDRMVANRNAARGLRSDTFLFGDNWELQ